MWKEFVKCGVMSALATLVLPVAAQAEDEKHPSREALVQEAAARQDRTEQARALAAPLMERGMDAVTAFELAWTALAAEEEGKGNAAALLAEMEHKNAAAVVESLSDEEFVALLNALEEVELGEKATFTEGFSALLKRLRGMLRNENAAVSLGKAKGLTSAVNPRWQRLVRESAVREGEMMPSVWWLQHASGSLLQHEPSAPAFLPPGVSAGSVHESLVEEEPAKQELRPGRREEIAASAADTLTTAAQNTLSLTLSTNSFGGGLAAAPMRSAALTMPPLMAAPAPSGSGAPGGDVVWKGNLADLTSGVSATFDKTAGNSKLDVTLESTWRPYDITVNDNGVTMSKHGINGVTPEGAVGYAFNGGGTIADYVDSNGETHATTLTKKGNGILVMANGANTYSGGTDVQGGVLYVADQDVLGTGAVTLHNGTQMWVNYTYTKDFSASFRNPSVSNTVKLTDGASATISYGDFPYRPILGVANSTTTRIWRNMYLTGGLSGDAASSLFLQSYNSRYGGSNFEVARKHLGGTVSLRGELWYGGFVLNRTEAADADRFYGTLTMGNRVNTGTASSDNLSNRETGAVKLMLSDDVLEYGTLDATREWKWCQESTGYGANNKLLLTGVYDGGSITATASDALKQAYAAAGGTASNYSQYGLRQTHSNTILISNNTKVGELKADFLGATQESYRDAVDWSESLEALAVRVVTLEDAATLTLGKTGEAGDSWFSGSVGLENIICDTDGDGKDILTKDNMNGVGSGAGLTVAGISLTKVGDNAQYIHTAKLNNLDVQDGTLGFNNVNLVNNLTLAGHSTLRLGVQDNRWKDEGTINLQVGAGGGSNHRFAVVTSELDSKAKSSDAPFSARVEGSLKLDDSTEVVFEVNPQGQESGERKPIIPAWVKEEGEDLKDQTDYLSSHALLQVTAATGRADGADKGGVLTLSNTAPISISGINFLKEDYTDKIYFLAAADQIAVNKNGTIGAASSFDTRVITLGYGYYGLVSTIDGHGTVIGGNYTPYAEDHASYLGQDYLVMRVAADPTRSWTGSAQTSADHAANVWTAAKEEHYEDYMKGTGLKADAQWKENRAYTDGVSVKFGNLWMPTAWSKYLAENPEAKVKDFSDLLTSNMVTKVNGELFTNANGAPGTGNGTVVSIGGVEHGREGSTYDGIGMEGHSDHYEKVVIEGTVRPGYVTIGSDFNLNQGDGTYVTVQDDTNYVFTGTGSIADATPEMMKEIYGSLLGNGGDTTMLDDWKTGLSKGGTGALVMLTENSYSGGTTLHGGFTVMGNKWALGMENPSLKKTDPRAKGGAVEMSYGAGLMADYITTDAVIGQLANTMEETLISNDLTITHMSDYDNKGAKGDAQLYNRYDSLLTVRNLSSYDDAILTLRGVSLRADDARAHKDGDSHTYFTFGEYLIANPVNAMGTIRMAGYLAGDDGSLVSPDGSSYVHGGGKVQLTLTGHDKTFLNRPLWKNTTIDLSLNGGAENVLVLNTGYIPNADSTAAAENTNGATPLYVTLGTLKDDGKSGHNARVVNDASSENLGNNAKERYLMTLILSPTSDASFSGDIGFGIAQNAQGAALPSRGYISLIKEGSAMQSVGNARLLDLTVKNSGLLHVQNSLSVRSVTTQVAGAQHIHVGEVGDASMSHTLTVGKGGVLSLDADLNTDPFNALKSSEGDTKYGSELGFVLLKDGATVTGSGNWYTSKGIAVYGGAEVTFNTHDYSMDDTVSSDMAVYGAAGQVLKDAFDDSHIFWLQNGLSGTGVTVNLVNEQMSAGATDATDAERGTATANGYILTHDLNAYLTSSKAVYYGLQGGSTVNIGAKTILQSYESATVNSGIEYNVKGEDAALQFLDAKSTTTKLDASKGYQSYVDKATLAEGGRIILGGAAVATSATTQNTESVKTDITADADVVLTNKAGQTASVQNMAVSTKNENGYETTLSAVDSGRATVENAVMTAKQGKTLVQDTDISNTLVNLQQSCTVSLEDVLITADSKVEGEGPASGNEGAEAIAYGATAAPTSVTLTDADTRINTTLTNVQNVVKNDVLIQVAKVNQLAQADVSGKGLTLGLTQETLEKATAAGARYLALQVSNSGRFLYEQQAVLESVKLTNHNGATYVNPAYDYKIVSSKDVADFLGVAQSEVSDTLLYIEVSEMPEPTTTALSLLALAALAARRKRK